MFAVTYYCFIGLDYVLSPPHSSLFTKNGPMAPITKFSLNALTILDLSYSDKL
jgi:hypothetical protein